MASLLPSANLRARGEQIVPAARNASLSQAGFGRVRTQPREHIHRRRVEADALFAPPQLKADLARVEVERDSPERLQYVGAEQQSGPVGQPEELERRHVGEGDRHI